MESYQAMEQRIAEARYDFRSQAFEQISPEAKDFILVLLQRNPT